MCEQIPKHFVEDLDMDYDYDFDESFIESKIGELDDLVKMLYGLYYQTELDIGVLLNMVLHKSAKLKRYFQFFLDTYKISEKF